MLIDPKYQIWKVTAQDDVRPILCGVKIEATGEPDARGNRTGRAIASDGFILAIVPVTLEETDTANLVHYRAFKWAMQMGRPKRGADLHLGLCADGIRLANGVLLPAATNYIRGVYPNLDGTINGFSGSAGIDQSPLQSGDPFPYDLNLLNRVAAAIGAVNLKVTQRFLKAPIMVEPITSSYPSLPFGLVMPIAVSSSWKNDASQLRTRWNKQPASNGHKLELAA